MLDTAGRLPAEAVPGVELFRDDRDPSRFYALPPTPRLARDDGGAPLYRLVLYGERDERGFRATGGLFTCTTCLPLPAEVEPRLRAWLAGRGGGRGAGEARVLAPDWVAGEAELALPGGPALEAQPSLMGDNRCCFHADLEGEAAEGLAERIEGGALGALAYRLEARCARRSASAATLRESRREDAEGRQAKASSTFRSEVTRRTAGTFHWSPQAMLEVEFPAGGGPVRRIELGEPGPDPR